MTNFVVRVIFSNEPLPKIIQQLFDASFANKKEANLRDVSTFVKKHESDIRKHCNFLRLFDFQSIEYFEINNLSSEQIEELHSRMEIAQDFLTRVYSHVCKIKKAHIVA